MKTSVLGDSPATSAQAPLVWTLRKKPRIVRFPPQQARLQRRGLGFLFPRWRREAPDAPHHPEKIPPNPPQ